MITRQLNLKILPKINLQQPLHRLKSFHSSQHARQLFDEIPLPNNASVHQSMLKKIGRDRHFDAIDIFKKQLQMGLADVDEVAVAIALKACRGDAKFGSQIHAFALSSGLYTYLTVPNSLMNMYSKAGNFNHALSIFEALNYRDMVSWNTILSGYKNAEDAFHFASQMNLNGLVFDPVTYTVVLAHCADQDEFHFGTQLHASALKYGLERELYVGNALITLYTKWGKIVEAGKVFNNMPKRDLVSWNALISGYSQEGYGVKALKAFIVMTRKRLYLDHVSYTSAVSACALERKLQLGRQIHGLIVKDGFEKHTSVSNVLISMYAKCEVRKDAQLVFGSMVVRNVVSWTTMLSINEEDSVSLFNEMRVDGVYPNDVTFVGLIHAITTMNMVHEGLMVHGFCVKTSFLLKPNVANSFITMYARFESMEDSKKIFDELDNRDIISWNALISGYVQNKMYKEAVDTFLLARLWLRPNQYSFGSVLSAIGSAESISLKYGEMVHSYLTKLGLEHDPIVSNAVLDMYAKRGSISESLKVFNELPERSQVAWTAIISAYARHGDYESVMHLFEEMERDAVKPDSITFLSVLSACGRKGMVEKGREIFESMVKTHSIVPFSEHYSCMVDMLGRAGRLEEAEEFMNQIPGGPGLTVLQGLLGSCRVHGNMEMGKRVADALIQLEPEESGSYVLLSNLYAEKGEWDKVAKIRKKMRIRGVKKEIGFSWADVGDAQGSLHLHGFSSDDRSHEQWEEIYEMAECVGSGMKLLGSKEEVEPIVIDI